PPPPPTSTLFPYTTLFRSDRHLYSVAALGQKIEWMRANPLVCFEADEMMTHDHWMSVVVQGRYEELPDTPEWRAGRQLAYSLLQDRKSTRLNSSHDQISYA